MKLQYLPGALAYITCLYVSSCILKLLVFENKIDFFLFFSYMVLSVSWLCICFDIFWTESVFSNVYLQYIQADNKIKIFDVHPSNKSFSFGTRYFFYYLFKLKWHSNFLHRWFGEELSHKRITYLFIRIYSLFFKSRIRVDYFTTRYFLCS